MPNYSTRAGLGKVVSGPKGGENRQTGPEMHFPGPFG